MIQVDNLLLIYGFPKKNQDIGRLSEIQKYRIFELQSMGDTVLVVYSFEEYKEEMNKYCQAIINNQIWL